MSEKMFDQLPRMEELPPWIQELAHKYGLREHEQTILNIRWQYNMAEVEDPSPIKSQFESMLRNILGEPTLETGPLYRSNHYGVSLLEYKRNDAQYPFAIIRENLTEEEKERIIERENNLQERGFIQAFPTEGETTTVAFLCYPKGENIEWDDETNIYAIELPLGYSFRERD